MEIPTEVAKFQALFYDGKPNPPGITVTVRPWWFEIRNVRHVKPSTLQVKRWWAIIRKPATDLDFSTQLHMIRRAMLEWPKMGAAIGKLAQQEHQQAKKKCRALKRQALNKFKKMVKNPVAEMIGDDKSHCASSNDKANMFAKTTGSRQNKRCKK
jgi:hypothetical protein